MDEVVADDLAEIAVTGSRIARPTVSSPSSITVIGQSSVAPAQPGRFEPEYRERYPSKEVATVLAGADAPVSLFGVDAESGSYANVRRMPLGGGMPPQGAVRTEEMLNCFRYDYPAPEDRTKPFSITPA